MCPQAATFVLGDLDRTDWPGLTATMLRTHSVKPTPDPAQNRLRYLPTFSFFFATMIVEPRLPNNSILALATHAGVVPRRPDRFSGWLPSYPHSAHAEVGIREQAIRKTCCSLLGRSSSPFIWASSSGFCCHLFHAAAAPHFPLFRISASVPFKFRLPSTPGTRDGQRTALRLLPCSFGTRQIPSWHSVSPRRRMVRRVGVAEGCRAEVVLPARERLTKTCSLCSRQNRDLRRILKDSRAVERWIMQEKQKGNAGT